MMDLNDAGWSSPVARRAHNPKVAGSNPAPATKKAQVRHHARPGLSFGGRCERLSTTMYRPSRVSPGREWMLGKCPMVAEPAPSSVEPEADPLALAARPAIYVANHGERPRMSAEAELHASCDGDPSPQRRRLRNEPEIIRSVGAPTTTAR